MWGLGLQICAPPYSDVLPPDTRKGRGGGWSPSSKGSAGSPPPASERNLGGHDWTLGLPSWREGDLSCVSPMSPHQGCTGRPGPGPPFPRYWPTCAWRGRGHEKLEAQEGEGCSGGPARSPALQRPPAPSRYFPCIDSGFCSRRRREEREARRSGSGPGTAALRTPSPARHLPLPPPPPPPVASHPWPHSQTAPGPSLVQWLRGCMGRGRPPQLLPAPDSPGTPRPAGSVFQIAAFLLMLCVFRLERLWPQFPLK